MKVEWDTENLVDFAQSISGEALEDAMLGALSTAGKEFLENVKNRTPVDTGNLRSNWSRNGNLSRMPKRRGNDYSVYYENAAINWRGSSPVMYASMVEEGYRHKGGKWIPGRWFQKASENVIEERMEKYIDKELREAVERACK